MDEPERASLFVGRLVRVREPATDRQRNLQGDLGGHRLLFSRGRANHFGCGGPLDELHRHVELRPFFAEIEDLNQVGVRELCAEPRFVDEHRDELGISRELRQDAFERNALGKTVRAFAAGNVNLRHAARCQLLQQLVRPQPQRGRGIRYLHTLYSARKRASWQGVQPPARGELPPLFQRRSLRDRGLSE